MKSSSTDILLWLRLASVVAVAFGSAMFAASWLYSNLWAGIESGLLVASLGGAFGALQYRVTLAITADSWQSVKLWILSVAWCQPFLLAALLVSRPSISPQPSLLSDFGMMIVAAAFMSLISFVPLKWLQGGVKPGNAP